MPALTQPSPASGRGLETAPFEEAAAWLAGVAGALLGWRADEFWESTPAEFGSVLAALVPEEANASAADLARLMEMYPDG